MTTRIDSIYCFDYTRKIGHYDSIRNFAAEKMTYIGLALSTPQNHVDANPITFDVPSIGSNHIREYTIEQLPNLNEISKELAVNSPKYILIRYFDGSERYFTYNEQFFAMFKIAFQYKPQEKTVDENVSPYVLQENESTTTTSYTRFQETPVEKQSHAAQPPAPNRATPLPHSNKKAASFSRGKLLLGIGILILIIALLINGTKEEADVNADLTPVSEPTSGTILSGYEDSNGAKISVTASSGKSCVVKLKTISGVTRLSFYVRAGDTVEIYVPCENLYVFFASGTTWYGQNHLFGKNTSYLVDNEIREFVKGHTYAYKLAPVEGGNLSLTSIDEDDF